MNTYSEGMVAIFICLMVLLFAIIGVAIYYFRERIKRDRDDLIKLRVLVESIVEIFNQYYGKEDDRNTGE